MSNIKTIRWADEAHSSILICYDNPEQTITQVMSYAPDYSSTIKAWEASGNVVEEYQRPAITDFIKDLATAKHEASLIVQASAYSLLSPTDWVVTREMETGAPAPADITAYRAAVRSTANDKIAAIESAGDLDDLTTYLRSDEFAAWPESPTA